MANWGDTLEYVDGYYYDSNDDTYYVKGADGLFYESESGDAYDVKGNYVDATTPKIGDTLLNLLNLGIQYGSSQLNQQNQQQPIKSAPLPVRNPPKTESKKSILMPILIGGSILAIGITIYFVRKK